MLNNVRRSLEAQVEISSVTREEQAERNAQIFTKHKDRSAAEVLADMQDSFAQASTSLRQSLKRF